MHKSCQVVLENSKEDEENDHWFTNNNTYHGFWGLLILLGDWIGIEVVWGVLLFYFIYFIIYRINKKWLFINLFITRTSRLGRNHRGLMLNSTKNLSTYKNNKNIENFWRQTNISETPKTSKDYNSTKYIPTSCPYNLSNKSSTKEPS